MVLVIAVKSIQHRFKKITAVIGWVMIFRSNFLSCINLVIKTKSKTSIIGSVGNIMSFSIEGTNALNGTDNGVKNTIIYIKTSSLTNAIKAMPNATAKIPK